MLVTWKKLGSFPFCLHKFGNSRDDMKIICLIEVWWNSPRKPFMPDVVLVATSSNILQISAVGFCYFHNFS